MNLKYIYAAAAVIVASVGIWRLSLTIPEYSPPTPVGEWGISKGVGDSMGDYSPDGTWLLWVQVPFEELRAGDDIVFEYKEATWDTPGRTHHRIERIIGNYVSTRGVGNTVGDRFETHRDHIHGLVIAHWKGGAWFPLKPEYIKYKYELGIDEPFYHP